MLFSSFVFFFLNLFYLAANGQAITQDISTTQATNVDVQVDCGLIEEDRIVGGIPVVGAGYPWFVALAVQQEPIQNGTQSPPYTVQCAASLITQRHLLTAAHCYTGTEKTTWPRKFTLIYLLRDRCTGPGEFGPPVKSVHVYRGKGVSDGQLMSSDIALITLEEKVNYTPICLPQGKSAENGEGTVLGFGSVNRNSSGGEQPCQLQFGMVNVIPWEECLLSTNDGPFIAGISDIFCAGRTDGSVDACNGDSGGPLQSLNEDGSWYLRGIVSFGIGCGLANTPGVYTDVGSYLEWIKDSINNQNKSRRSHKHHRFCENFQSSKGDWLSWMKNLIWD